MPDSGPRRLVVAITGATGAVYGVRLVQQLAATPGIETHLIVSDAAVLLSLVLAAGVWLAVLWPVVAALLD